jgi:hypothetical protein
LRVPKVVGEEHLQRQSAEAVLPSGSQRAKGELFKFRLIDVTIHAGAFQLFEVKAGQFKKDKSLVIMKYGLFILIIFLSGCTYNNLNTNQVTLEGKWVDINSKTDTLSFGFFGGKESIMLGRGKEMRDGFLVPKYGSGPYDYKLLQVDKISLHWALSSNGSFIDYYFRQTGDRLIIGNFFNAANPGTLLTFKKIN